jgi:type IV secretory pathway VirD2 relaxase
MFGAEGQDSDARAFADHCADDRHHFRFIVSPDDALEMTDLRAFARDLMSEMERDLGTKLEWIAVDHWNTEHPHVHIIVRGKVDDGEDLVISRDYISNGLRDRAEHLSPWNLGREVISRSAENLAHKSMQTAGQARRCARAPRTLPDAGCPAALERMHCRSASGHTGAKRA